MRLEPLCGPVCLSHPRIGMPSTNTSKPPDPASDASPPVKSVRRKPNRRTYAIPKVAFRRMVQDIASEYKSDLRFQREAFDALQESAEQLVTKQFARCSQLADLCKLDTVRHEHWRFVQDNPGDGLGVPCSGTS